MKNILLSLCCAFISLIAFPQQPGAFNRPGGNQNMNMGHLYGKVVDSKTNKGIPGATVQLIGTPFGMQQRKDSTSRHDSTFRRSDTAFHRDSAFHKIDTARQFDTSGHKTSQKSGEVILATVLAEANGDFSLENLPVFGNFKLHITAVGYANYVGPVSFGLKFQRDNNNANVDQQQRMQQMIGMIDKDLGNIKLQQSETTLANVTVTAAAKPFFEMGVDRKIFNVDKNIVSTGQTAVEVMKQIPSVNVDIDGNVKVRNATPQLFVDGRPTTLTLDQIPADLIDKVELITNPSAKYDASGGNAGILNIVLKKNIKRGYNGGIRAGIDSRGKINTGADINYRQGKVNLFFNGMYNQRKSISTSNTYRNNFYDPPSVINQSSKGTSNGYFSFVRGGLDYFIDNRNTISLEGRYVRGHFTNNEDQNIDSVINDVFQTHNDRYADNTSNFKNVGTRLSFKHNFAENGHDITADINYNWSNNDNNGNYTTNYFTPENSVKYPPLLQQTKNSGSNKFLTVQSDYENQINDKMKIEAGVRAAIRNFENMSDQFYYNYATNMYELLPSISSNYKYKDQVYAAYSTYTLKVKNWSYQLGLRVESSNYDGSLVGKDSSFSVKYPVSLFPSSFLTYKLDDKQDIQVNYSRRVNRPNFFQLIPFIDNSDPLNLSVGNPGLKPEFINSFELNYNYAYKKGANFLVSAFYKYTSNLITNYIYRIPNPDTSIYHYDSVYLTTYVNAQSSTSYGVEFTNRITLVKIWDMTVNLNIFNSKINASNVQTDLINQRWSWFAKMNNNFKLPKGFSIQLSGNYQAKTVLPASSEGGRGGRGFFGGPVTTAQGYINPFYSFDIALKKDWTFKNGQSLSATLSMNDFLRTQKYSTYSKSQYFTQTSERRRDPQILRLNLSYRFGKMDASLFKRKNTRQDEGQDVTNGQQ
jgi:outer membrane receptor protein involved in Fe transport